MVPGLTENEESRVWKMAEKINESAPRPGKTVYGAALGILMLDTAFPRIHGDIGNAETWPFPVIYKIVDGATSDKVVRKGAAGLRDDFAKAAGEVVAMGADGIGTMRVPLPCSKTISREPRAFRWRVRL